MTDPLYVRQERYLRYILDRYLRFEGLGHARSENVERFIAKEPRSVVGLFLKGDLVLAVSRRNRPHDLGLPGGKIDPIETPEDAVEREVLEETGVKILKAEFCYERVDATDGRVAWCYRVHDWEGEPTQREDGISVVWVDYHRLLDPSCTFADYNRGLFKAIGLSR